MRTKGMPALDLIEEAVHLLRLAPFDVLLTYYIGAAPFVIGFLFFWSDMSRSPFAIERCAPFALLLAVLFIWMKACQMMFARRLREQITGRSLEPVGGVEWFGMIASQIFVQATSLILVPIALILTVPAGWVLAFYQNTSALGGVNTSHDRSRLGAVVVQTKLWPGQNHVVLLILIFFGFLVFLNVVSLLLAVPYLLKTILAIETAASQSWWAMLNTTFVAAAFAITWLCVDPIVKAIYVLRCFYGQSVTDGADLRSELRSIRLRRSLLMAAVGIMLFTSGGVLRGASDDAPTSSLLEQSVSNSELDQAIDDTLRKREFAWRMPRENLEDTTTSGNWMSNMITRSLDWLGAKMKAVFKSVFEFVRWLFDKLFDSNQPSSPAGSGWLNAIRGLFVLVIILLVGVLGFLIWRLWRNRRQNPVTVGEAAVPVPNLEDNDVTAADLPENEWLKLAREMVAKGEYRLALRAFYLAGLANLAERGLLTIERYKSNRDYRVELDRRGHALPNLVNAFSSNVLVFDRVWYGCHEADEKLLSQFEGNLEKICNA